MIHHGVHGRHALPCQFIRDVGVVVTKAADPGRTRDAPKIRREGGDRRPVDDCAVEAHAALARVDVAPLGVW